MTGLRAAAFPLISTSPTKTPPIGVVGIARKIARRRNLRSEKKTKSNEKNALAMTIHMRVDPSLVMMYQSSDARSS